MERGRLFIAPGHDHDRETELAERGAGYFRLVISS
jgi:hypothetical protein